MALKIVMNRFVDRRRMVTRQVVLMPRLIIYISDGRNIYFKLEEAFFFEPGIIKNGAQITRSTVREDSDYPGRFF